MEILILLIFVCVLLVGVAVAFFAWTVRQGTFDQADRLALLPLDDETTVTKSSRDPEELRARLRDWLAGQVDDAFFEPLPEEEFEAWEGA